MTSDRPPTTILHALDDNGTLEVTAAGLLTKAAYLKLLFEFEQRTAVEHVERVILDAGGLVMAMTIFDWCACIRTRLGRFPRMPMALVVPQAIIPIARAHVTFMRRYGRDRVLCQSVEAARAWAAAQAAGPQSPADIFSRLRLQSSEQEPTRSS